VGNLLVCGPTEKLDSIANAISEVIEAKGKTINGEFRGKATKLKDISKAHKIIESHII